MVAFQLPAVGHERGVGFNFLEDAVFFKNLFDAQHLLNLVADGGFRLELQVQVFPQLHATQLAVGNDLRLV